jgi:hypothetical protein
VVPPRLACTRPRLGEHSEPEAARSERWQGTSAHAQTCCGRIHTRRPACGCSVAAPAGPAPPPDPTCSGPTCRARLPRADVAPTIHPSPAPRHHRGPGGAPYRSPSDDPSPADSQAEPAGGPALTPQPAVARHATSAADRPVLLTSAATAGLHPQATAGLHAQAPTRLHTEPPAARGVFRAPPAIQPVPTQPPGTGATASTSATAPG